MVWYQKKLKQAFYPITPSSKIPQGLQYNQQIDQTHSDIISKKVQWGKKEEETTIKELKQQYNDIPNIFKNMSKLEGMITLEELRIVLRRCKNNKSPGADGIPLEFFKWLTDEALQPILDLLNECWAAEVMPSNLELTDVITLYKKGNVEDPPNYRPISLLNVFYKLFAINF